MKVKLTVYLDESLKRLIKAISGKRKVSAVVNDALESYFAEDLIGHLGLPNNIPTSGLPSLSEVKRRIPKVSGSSAKIIASQRTIRNACLSS